MSSRLIGLTLAVALTVPAMGAAPPGETVLRAMEALTALLDGDSRPPPQLLEATTCIAVIPHVIKGAFVLGGRRGNGIISCRHDGGWTPHAFLTLSGTSVGFQIGGESTDIVLLIVNERSVRSLLKSKFTLGADASVAAGLQLHCPPPAPRYDSSELNTAATASNQATEGNSTIAYTGFTN